VETLNAAKLIAGLGHESRLAIFRLLVEAGPEGMNASSETKKLGSEQHLLEGKTVTSNKTVLVLYTGNSCRSQMAEVILNNDLAGKVRALSAGTRPQPQVADAAIEALQTRGPSG